MTSISLGFEVTDVKKPVLSVNRICEKGNVVQFGRKEGESFIKNSSSGEWVPLRMRNKSYVMDVQLCVDSAAEESVCPKDWAEVYGLEPGQGRKISLINATGGAIQHYGRRNVVLGLTRFFRGKADETPRVVDFAYKSQQ